MVLEDSAKDLEVSLGSKDFMTSLDKLEGLVDSNSSHLGIYLMNLRSSLVALKEAAQGVLEEGRQLRGERI